MKVDFKMNIVRDVYIYSWYMSSPISILISPRYSLELYVKLKWRILWNELGTLLLILASHSLCSGMIYRLVLLLLLRFSLCSKVTFLENFQSYKSQVFIGYAKIASISWSAHRSSRCYSNFELPFCSVF